MQAEIIQLVSKLQTTTLICVVCLLMVCAIGTVIGFTILGCKFLECSSRQPEIMAQLQTRLYVIAALVDAVAMIAVGVALLMLFFNPFLKGLQPYLT